MPITKTWSVVQLDAYETFEGKPKVVYTVHWALDAVDETGRTSRAYGAVDLRLTPGAPFTPFENLTKQQVIGWVHGALGPELKTLTEGLVDQRIAEQNNPTTETYQPNW